MMAAVQIYNNPQITFKSESFITLTVIEGPIKDALRRNAELIYNREFYYLQHILLFFDGIEELARKKFRTYKTDEGKEQFSEEEVIEMAKIKSYLSVPGIFTLEERARLTILMVNLGIALNYLLKVLHTEPYYGVWTRKERLRIIGREANWWEDMEKRNIGK